MAVSRSIVYGRGQLLRVNRAIRYMNSEIGNLVCRANNSPVPTFVVTRRLPIYVCVWAYNRPMVDSSIDLTWV